MPVSPFQTCRTLPKLAFQLPLHQVCRPRHKVRGVHTLLQRIGDPVTCLWLQGTMCHKTHPPRSPEPSACGNRQSLPNGHVPDGDRSEIGKSHRGYVIIYIYIHSQLEDVNSFDHFFTFPVTPLTRRLNGSGFDND